MSSAEGQVKGCCPVRWLDHGRQVIVALPEHVNVSTASPIREQLLTIINRGAGTLIADMSATMSCDHAGTDTLARVYQRAATSGTELRLVVTAPGIRRVLGISGLDRLVSIYPVLEAALAAHRPAVVLPLARGAARTGATGPALADAAGSVIQLPGGALPGSRATAHQQHHQEMLGRITSSLFEVGIVLSTAADMPPGSLKERVDEAVRLLDDLVRGIYDAAFGGCEHPSEAPARQPGR